MIYDSIPVFPIVTFTKPKPDQPNFFKYLQPDVKIYLKSKFHHESAKGDLTLISKTK